MGHNFMYMIWAFLIFLAVLGVLGMNNSANLSEKPLIFKEISKNFQTFPIKNYVT
jgi:hypothetical protein